MPVPASGPAASVTLDAARLTLCQLEVGPDTTAADLFRRVCEIAADTLNVNRVSVWLFTPDRQAIRCENLFERLPREHSHGAVLRVTDAPAYFRSWTERRVVTALSTDDSPAARELTESYFRPLGIAGTVDAPIYLRGQISGVVCHETTTPRRWTADEQAFVATVADQVSLLLKVLEIRDLEANPGRPAVTAPDPADRLFQMAAGVGHDFRNLLTVVLGQADLLARDRDATEPIRSGLTRIIDAAERGAVLANELMNFGRVNRNAVRVTRVGEAVERLLPVLRLAAGDAHPVEFTRTPGAGRALLDPAQLERVLLNLVLNAKDAMPGGGPIRVTVGGEAVTGDDRLPQYYSRVEVSDSGHGIPPAALARIFEPFFTTKEAGQGTGLGLAVVQQIIDRYGGFVRVASGEGTGTTFRVYLPRVSGSIIAPGL